MRVRVGGLKVRGLEAGFRGAFDSSEESEWAREKIDSYRSWVVGARSPTFDSKVGSLYRTFPVFFFEKKCKKSPIERANFWCFLRDFLQSSHIEDRLKHFVE